MKTCISISLYGENICKYYVPLLWFLVNQSKIIDTNTTDIVVHVDEQKYDLFISMLAQENLHNTSNIKIRKYPTKLMSYGMLWRFIPIFEGQYDCIVVTDTDSIFQSNIVNIFHQGLIDCIEDKAFCMAINGLCIQNTKLLRTYVQGTNLVFFPKNMTNLAVIKKYFYKILDECNAVIYGFDEMMLSVFLHNDIVKDNYVFFKQSNVKFDLDKYIFNIHKNIVEFQIKRYQNLIALKYGSTKKYSVNGIVYEYVPYMQPTTDNKFFADFFKGKFILEEFMKADYQETLKQSN